MALRFVQIIDGAAGWIFTDQATFDHYQSPAIAADGRQLDMSYAQALGLTFLDLHDDAVQEGWLFDGARFSAPPPPAPPPVPIAQPSELELLVTALIKKKIITADDLKPAADAAAQPLDPNV